MKKHDAMGSRFWFGVLLLLGLLAVSMLGGVLMERMHSSVFQKLEQAAGMALSGEMDAGITLAQQAREAWETSWKWTASAADQTPMDTIDSLFSQLQAYEAAGATADFAACCYQLSKLVQSVADAHQAAWWNIL